jgi:hypothetical protein
MHKTSFMGWKRQDRPAYRSRAGAGGVPGLGDPSRLRLLDDNEAAYDILLRAVRHTERRWPFATLC